MQQGPNLCPTSVKLTANGHHVIWNWCPALDACFGCSLTGVVQEQFQGIMSALEEYWNGTMTTYFWGAQVGQEMTVPTHGFQSQQATE